MQPGLGKTILFVDDNPNIRSYVKYALDLAIIGAGFGVNRMSLIEDEVISQGDLNSDGTIVNLDLSGFITLYRFRSLHE